MIKAPDHPIVLLEANGERRNFDPVELQNTLIRCFLGAGLQENCYLAEDIALAVEYAFEHCGRTGKVFARSELDSAVIRILEDTGLADVAALFRRGAPGMLSVECRGDKSTVVTVLRKFMAGSDAHLDGLAGKVAEALRTLRIEATAPGLMVELARHYEAFAPLPAVPTPSMGGGRLDEFYSVSAEEIAAALVPETRKLVRSGVIRLHGVSRILPSVRLFCFLNRYAMGEDWAPPVTEMVLAPRLFALGRHLECCRLTALRLFREVGGDPHARLPVYLSLPDVGDFTERYLEVSHSRTEQLARELGQMLAEELGVTVEKLNLSISG